MTTGEGVLMNRAQTHAEGENIARYTDDFYKSVQYFNEIYSNGLTNSPISLDKMSCGGAVDKAVLSLGTAFYSTFFCLGKVIVRHGE